MVILIPSPTPEILINALPSTIGPVKLELPTRIVILPVASFGTSTVTFVLFSKTEVLSTFTLISTLDTLNVALPVLFKYLALPL